MLKSQFEESNYLRLCYKCSFWPGLPHRPSLGPSRTLRSVTVGGTKTLRVRKDSEGQVEKHLLADAGQKVQRPNNTLSTDTVEQSGHLVK